MEMQIICSIFPLSRTYPFSCNSFARKYRHLHLTLKTVNRNNFHVCGEQNFHALFFIVFVAS